MDRIMKKVSESRTEQIQILMPAHINGYKRLFGGKLVEWIDVVAAVVARRHSGRNVTTASIDNLIFAEAAYVNSTVVLIGEMWGAPPWRCGWIPLWRRWMEPASRSTVLILCWLRWMSRTSPCLYLALSRKPTRKRQNGRRESAATSCAANAERRTSSTAPDDCLLWGVMHHLPRVVPYLFKDPLDRLILLCRYTLIKGLEKPALNGKAFLDNTLRLRRGE